ncbi:MAG: hypothetical protein OHK0056_25420 [Bacteriovoracaceae bacterium]
MDNYFNIELDDLADKIGDFIHYWGFKKIHGKIWCHLFLFKGPIDQQTLMKKLKVSKALMSQSLKELEEFGVIQSIGKEGGRCELYISHPSVINAIMTVLRNREKKMLANIFSSYRNLQSLNAEQIENLGLDSARINTLGRMITFAERFLTVLINFDVFDFSKFREIFHKKEGPKLIYTPFSRQVLKQAFLEFGVKSSKGVDHERPFEL